MQPPPSLNRAVPRSGSSPEISLLPPSIGQARAAGAPPKAASSLSLSSSPAQRELPPNAAGLLPLSIEQPRAAISLSSSPAQRELPPKQPPPSLNRTAPRSGSSPQSSLLPLASLSSSPAQRKLPPKQSPPALYRAAPRSGSSPQSSLLPLSVEQPRAGGAPPNAASSLPQSGSPAQRELP